MACHLAWLVPEVFQRLKGVCIELQSAYAEPIFMHNATASLLDCRWISHIFRWMHSFSRHSESGICLAMRNLVLNLSSSYPGQAGEIPRPSHSETARVAYQLFLEQGSQHGHDLDDWQRPPLPPPKSDSELLNEYPFAGDQRGISDREDIRRKKTLFRPTSRQMCSGRHNKSHKVESLTSTRRTISRAIADMTAPA